MATKFDLRTNLSDNKPFYAFVGAADTAVTTVRTRIDNVLSDATSAVQTLRSELEPAAVQAKINKTVADMRAQVQSLPTTASDRFDEASEDANSTYQVYVKRGQDVVASVRKQAQDTQTEAIKRAQDTRAAATSTFHAGRKEAAKGVAAVAGQVETDAEQVVRSEAAREGAAKRVTRKPAAKKTTARKTTPRKASARKTVTKSTAKA